MQLREFFEGRSLSEVERARAHEAEKAHRAALREVTKPKARQPMSPAPAPRREPARPTRTRLAVNGKEAARLLGVSVDFFDEHIRHELRCVYRGRRRMFPVSALEAWLDREAGRVSIDHTRQRHA